MDERFQEIKDLINELVCDKNIGTETLLEQFLEINSDLSTHIMGFRADLQAREG